MFQPSGRLGPPRAEIGIRDLVTKQEICVFDRNVQCLMFYQKFAERNLTGLYPSLVSPRLAILPAHYIVVDLVRITHINQHTARNCKNLRFLKGEVYVSIDH
jgi:hypothetical protein